MSGGTTRQHAAAALCREYKLDALCDAFEAEWKRGRQPSIKSALAGVEEDDVQDLLEALISVDLFYRQKAQTPWSVDEYASAFPDDTLPQALVLEMRRAAGDSQFEVRRGQRIGPYELEERIGFGSFGVVWRAKHLELGRSDALKLPQQNVADFGAAAVFQHEARAAAQLRHPHIVGVLGFGEWQSQAYIAFEYVAGETLKSAKQQKCWDHREAAELLTKILDALQHAHENGIVHRDLKPGNILLDETGEPHVSDFGLAKRLDAETTIAVDGMVMGTIPYMSPEQVAADHAEVDAATDIYAAGAMLYELLTGRVPFAGDRVAMMRAIEQTAPPSLQSIDAAIPDELEAICLKALQKKKVDRYSTAADFRDDLQRWLDGRRVVARPISIVTLAKRWIQQHPMLLLTWMAFILTLITTTMTAGLALYDSAAVGIEFYDDGKWDVHMTGDVEGIPMVVTPVDPHTQDPNGGTPIPATTPFNRRLLPGMYEVTWKALGKDERTYRIVPERSYDVGKYPIAPTWEWQGGERIQWRRIVRNKL